MFKIVLIDSNLFFLLNILKIRICFENLLEQNRISGSRHPENRLFFKDPETGQPFKQTGKPNSCFSLSGQYPANRITNPASRILACCSRVHIRSTGSQIRQTVFGSSRFCPITGQPVRKSGKPDSWALVLLLLPLSWVFCTCSSSLSLKTVSHPHPFPINSSSFLNHFYVKINLLNHYPCISSSLHISPSWFLHFFSFISSSSLTREQ